MDPYKVHRPNDFDENVRKTLVRLDVCIPEHRNHRTAATLTAGMPVGELVVEHGPQNCG